MTSPPPLGKRCGGDWRPVATSHRRLQRKSCWRPGWSAGGGGPHARWSQKCPPSRRVSSGPHGCRRRGSRHWEWTHQARRSARSNCHRRAGGVRHGRWGAGRRRSSRWQPRLKASRRPQKHCRLGPGHWERSHHAWLKHARMNECSAGEGGRPHPLQARRRRPLWCLPTRRGRRSGGHRKGAGERTIACFIGRVLLSESAAVSRARLAALVRGGCAGQLQVVVGRGRWWRRQKRGQLVRPLAVRPHPLAERTGEGGSCTKLGHKAVENELEGGRNRQPCDRNAHLLCEGVEFTQAPAAC
mmetsp:Transcript_32604/g.59501  ORF Transcript_32604/g.59501 Transcript_32604/m.59501 type:complete len:299 (+) Transcript_32604:813-1709(+)